MFFCAWILSAFRVLWPLLNESGRDCARSLSMIKPFFLLPPSKLWAAARRLCIYPLGVPGELPDSSFIGSNLFSGLLIKIIEQNISWVRKLRNKEQHRDFKWSPSPCSLSFYFCGKFRWHALIERLSSLRASLSHSQSIKEKAREVSLDELELFNFTGPVVSYLKKYCWHT